MKLALEILAVVVGLVAFVALAIWLAPIMATR